MKNPLKIFWQLMDDFSMPKIAFMVTLLSSATAFGQTNVCVGTQSTVTISRSIGCSAGTGSDAQWDGASGGTISDPGGMNSSFTVTWTTTGTFRLKRVFPAACGSTGQPIVLYSSYYVSAAATAGTLSGGGTFDVSVNTTLTLTGSSGGVNKWYYKENGGAVVTVASTSTTLNVNFTNSTTSPIIRQYWAEVGPTCYKTTNMVTVDVEPSKTPTMFSCVGNTSSMTITRSIGCGYGTGSDAQWDGLVGGTISDPGGSNSSFNVTWTTPGIFRLKRVFPTQCGSPSIYTEYVQVYAAPTASNAGSNQTICVTSFAPLSANAPTVGTGAWSVLSGPSTAASQFSSTTNRLASFSPAGGAGNYVLQWTITNGTCTSVSNVTITAVATPTVANAGADQSMCVTGTKVLGANTATVGTGVWSVLTGPSTSTSQFSNVNSPTATFTPAGGSGTYSLYWTINNSPCLRSTDNMVISVIPLPTTSNAGAGRTICIGTTTTLAANTPANGTGTWSVATGPSTLASQFSNVNSPTAVFTPAGGAGTYSLNWTIANSPCTSSISSTFVTVKPLPTTSVAGANKTTVVSTSVTLGANSPSSGTGAWSVKSGPSLLSSQFGSITSPTSTFKAAGGAGAYVLTWTISNSPCSSSASDVTVTVNPDPITGEPSPNTTTTYTYQLAASGALTWSIAQGTATVVSSGYTSATGIAWANVAWAIPGAGKLQAKSGTLLLGEKSVTVICTIPGNPTYTVMKDPGNGVFIPSTNSSPGPAIFKLDASVGSNATTVRWYTVSTGGSPLSDPYTTSRLTSTTTFYVTSYHATSGCESARLPVTMTITNNLSAWLTMPNGPESFAVGDVITPTFDKTAYYPPNIGVELYKGATRIYQDASTGNTKTIPTSTLTGGSDYKVKIYDISNPSLSDMSDAFFKIMPPHRPQRYYNGTIAAVQWRTDKAFQSPSSDYTGAYAYKYDKSYQLKEANWINPNDLFELSNKFEVTGISYDANGNLLSMLRTDAAGATANNFTYQYNQARAASDIYNNQLDGIPGYATYKYDAVGRLTDQDMATGTDQYMDYDVTGKVTAVYSDPTKTLASKVVEYLYDDHGFRLAKVNYAAPQKTTWYIRDVSGDILRIYEQDGPPATTGTRTVVQKEIPVYGASKLGTYYPDAVQDNNGSVMYELTDHLGNVRALVADNFELYKATMEDNGAADITNPRVYEMQYFENLFETQEQNAFLNISAPTAEVPSPNKVANLYFNDVAGTQAADKAIGPAIALEVRPGDKINIEAWAHYDAQTSFSKDFTLAALSTFLGPTFVNLPGFEGMPVSTVSNNVLNSLTAAGYANDDVGNTAPYAYLNYILYDANMVMIDAGWKRVPVEASSTTATKPIRIAIDEQIVPTQQGYVYVWVSNQSKLATVRFDDVTVKHEQVLVAQATDYGAWGDVVREQKADPAKIYRFAYQGQFSEKDNETGWNHFDLREYDAVIGRWTVTDPMGQYWSPYVGMGNNPGNLTDPTGGCTDGNGNPIPCPDGIPEKGNENTRILDEVVVSDSRMDAATYRISVAEKYLGQKQYFQLRAPDGTFLDDKYFDCSEFVLRVLKESDPDIYNKLVTKEKGGYLNQNTATMQKQIKAMGGKFRKTKPQVGDLIMWGGHVELIRTVNGEKFTTIGAGGKNYTVVPRVMGMDRKTGKFNWLHTSHEDIETLGTGGYLGIWTPN